MFRTWLCQLFEIICLTRHANSYLIFHNLRFNSYLLHKEVTSLILTIYLIYTVVMVIHKVHPVNFEKPHTYRCKMNLFVLFFHPHTLTHTTNTRRHLEATDACNGGNYRRHDPVSSSLVSVIHKRLWNRSNGGQHKQKLPLRFKPSELNAAGGGVK